MEIENLKELQKVIQLCRKLGVDTIEIGNVKFQLGPAPKVNSKDERDSIVRDFPEAIIPVPRFNGILPEQVQPPEKIETDELTEEQLMYYSSDAQVEN